MAIFEYVLYASLPLMDLLLIDSRPSWLYYASRHLRIGYNHSACAFQIQPFKHLLISRTRNRQLHSLLVIIPVPALASIAKVTGLGLGMDDTTRSLQDYDSKKTRAPTPIPTPTTTQPKTMRMKTKKWVSTIQRLYPNLQSRNRQS